MLIFFIVAVQIFDTHYIYNFIEILLKYNNLFRLNFVINSSGSYQYHKDQIISELIIANSSEVEPNSAWIVNIIKLNVRKFE